MSQESLDHLAAAFNEALQKLPSDITEKQAKRALRKYIARTDPAYAGLSVSARRTAASRDRAQLFKKPQFLIFVEKPSQL